MTPHRLTPKPLSLFQLLYALVALFVFASLACSQSGGSSGENPTSASLPGPERVWSIRSLRDLVALEGLGPDEIIEYFDPHVFCMGSVDGDRPRICELGKDVAIHSSALEECNLAIHYSMPELAVYFLPEGVEKIIAYGLNLQIADEALLAFGLPPLPADRERVNRDGSVMYFWQDVEPFAMIEIRSLPGASSKAEHLAIWFRNDRMMQLELDGVLGTRPIESHECEGLWEDVLDPLIVIRPSGGSCIDPSL
jgi:hypothetical protein